MLKFPVTGWPNEIDFNKIIDEIERIISNPKVIEFKIGRTNDPDRRKREHGCDDIQQLYKTKSVDYVCELENDLIDYFIGRPKCTNYADDERGNVSKNGYNYVYIALWYRQG